MADCSNTRILETEESSPVLTVCFRANRIRVGLVSESGIVLDGRNYACDRTSPMRLVDGMCAALEDFVARHGGGRGLRSVGVSVGGWVDAERGMWRYTRKIAAFQEPVLLASLLQRRTGLQAYIDNTLHLSTLAELRCGVGRRVSNLLYYHVGSGIGVGIVTEKHLIRGTANYSGECGHGYYDVVGKGEYQRLEDFASAWGMVSAAKALLPDHPGSVLNQAEKDGPLTFQTIYDGFRQGDSLCEHVLHRALRGIGFSVVNLLSITNSEALVFGGGILTDGYMLQWLIDFLDEYLSPPTRQTLGYVGTSLINAEDIAMIGASYMVREKEQRADIREPHHIMSI